MLEGLLIDLVPYRKPFRDLERDAVMGPSGFWSWAGDVPLVTQAAWDANWERWLEREGGDPQRTVWFGIQTKAGVPVGRIKARVVPQHRQAILGSNIAHPSDWRKGYGTDALLLLAEYCFDWLAVRKVWLGTLGNNAKVHGMMAKLGFSQDLRQRDAAYGGGQWIDMVVYSMLRSEWPGREAMIARAALRSTL